ncbi:alanine--tRNA ligase [Streptomyces albidoflavus]|jgi:alanyl-tRNA synthetase|uniref:Alanine--tRNA ligase n=3 Tax=Streptomyces TaxID=1883 RepID=D6B972_9ACTN|nr:MULTISPECIES: alanine--tRNA ligase [Streptomyces]MBO1283334.1 alanine--tRNA ligase [Streptomyces sampsonii]MYX52615.1 alanine--tRNA ligase [Streptomyces sp. SID8385]MYX84170.1 alanine--tRNA ligase [Streptomyces sp. SID4915]NUW10140.1 alanine--tRNA ligase [Streptomyces sp. CAI-21]NVI30000.1 alanine--tRNA ligase [Streptomyces sp. CAI-17]QLA59948.1 alanine--tRNA ligase [Streptomyces violascens]SCE41480.1 alanyl-tRNA synthetase [Streptomyces sp. IgraMP-1]BDH54453.1 alanine--tRNA ligase [Stre
MESAEIRRRWLRFFEERGHAVVPSASLIADDPTLLLVPAGMVPFKPYFLGEATPPAPRATSVQKCVRTPDIEEVGKTTRHGTFFQMCGNFSFGDYFKEGAITYAWELLTTSQEQGGYGLDPERLWITVYLDDDEAETIWREKIGVPAERIQRLGKKDNFWSMGVPGPCGPCSEINYDRGPEFGVEGGPAVNDERYVEIWNLVFMQYERGAGEDKENFPILGDLPSKNIDTGLGLERLAMILQDVRNLYEIDTSRIVIDKATELTGVQYGADQASDVSLRVVTDHMRTSVMLIGDGVTPGNEGRGYVLRRIMRRAVRNMRLLGATGPVVAELVDTVIESMGQQYPELITERKRILTVALAEEAAFLKALKGGTNILDTAVTETKAAGSTVLSGDKAFLLHDTWGFPIDLTLEMAAEQGLSVDEPGFRRLMKEQRERAKADARAKKTGHADLSAYREVADAAGATDFTGYLATEGESTVVGLLVDGVSSPAATEGDEVEIVLDRTPFYAEGGGQIADTGRIRFDNGAVVEVRDVQKPVPGVHVHKGVVQVGEVTVGSPAYAAIDVGRRRAIARAHSATHLTHQALRDALGPTAAQAGSENQPGRFRFDFGSPAAVPGAVLTDVEQKINEVLARDLDVQAEVMSIDDAKKQGAIAEFGEKYGERVRVVTIGDFSKELCGGTHVHNTAQLGLVKLLGESSIGSGVRRIEALVGVDAYNFLAKEHTVVAQLQELVKGRPEELPEKVSAMLGKLKEAEKEIERFRAEKVLQAAAGLAAGAQDVRGTALVTGRVPDGTGADDLRKLVLDVRGRIPADRPAVVALFTVANDRPLTVVATNEAARERGLKAGDLVRTAAKTLGGGGGGKPDVAQGGGQNPQAIDEAVSAVERQVAESAR